MAWKIEFDAGTEKQLKKLDKPTLRRIFTYLNQKVATAADPRQLGKPLRGSLANLWRYRVGNHRIICQITDNTMTILVVRLGHRKDIYKKQPHCYEPH